MTTAEKTNFTDEDFRHALLALDTEIAKSKNLRAAAPIKLLSAGGFVAVALFRNRDSTHIDYIIDPEIRNAAKVGQKLQNAIISVAVKQNLSKEWINSHMEIFAPGDTKQRLFRDSVSQGVVLWRGTNLIIYAAKWEWTLARKLKRIGSERREIDVSDAVGILAQMVQDNAGPLSYEPVKSWDAIVYTSLDDAAIKRVAEEFLARFGYVGI